MITALQIENFKGIGAADPPASPPFRIEFRPITLLFGANSSGKSTVIQALLYAHEILDRRNFDPDRTVLGGDAVDLGGYRNFVHREGALPGEGPVRLRFELNLSAESLPEFLSDEELLALAGVENSDQLERLRAELAEDNLSTRVESAAVELQVEWSEFKSTAQLTSYRIWLNGEFFARIEDTAEGGRSAITEFNFAHPLLKLPPDPTIPESDEDETDHILVEFMERYRAPRPDGSAAPPPEAVICNLEALSSALPDLDGLLKLEEKKQATSGLKENLEQQLSGLGTRELEVFVGAVERELQTRLRCVRILSQALAGPGQLLRDHLRGLRYVGPLRRVPPRNYEPPRFYDPGRWADGIAAWDALYAADDGLVQEIGQWMRTGDTPGQANRLNTGYRLRTRRTLQIDAIYRSAALRSDAIYEVIDDLAAELRSKCEKKQIFLVEERTWSAPRKKSLERGGDPSCHGTFSGVQHLLARHLQAHIEAESLRRLEPLRQAYCRESVLHALLRRKLCRTSINNSQLRKGGAQQLVQLRTVFLQVRAKTPGGL